VVGVWAKTTTTVDLRLQTLCTKMMDKVDCVGSELNLIKILIGVLCLIELFKMLLYCAKSM